MSLTVRVDRGTGAGVRPAFQGQPGEWVCGCLEPECCGEMVEGDCCQEPVPGPRFRPGYLARCPDCGEPRPR